MKDEDFFVPKGRRRPVPPHIRVFSKWDHLAGVKQPQKSSITIESSDRLHFCPPGSLSYLNSEVLAAASEEQKWLLEAEHCAGRLEMTAQVEDLLVGPSARIIYSGRVPLLDPTLRDEARYVELDELFHSILSIEAAKAVRKCAGIDERDKSEHAFVRAFYRRLASAFGLERAMLFTVWSIAVEVLITSELNEGAGHDCVYPEISKVLSLHGADERRHRAYYESIFSALWVNLTEEGKLFFEAEIEAAARAYLATDVSRLARAFAKVGLPVDDADKAAREAVGSELAYVGDCIQQTRDRLFGREYRSRLGGHHRLPKAG